ncbi:MAG: hypothetical protein WCK67_02380 [bacterium]
MQKSFFLGLFSNKDDKPVGLVSLGIKKNNVASKKNSFANNYEPINLGIKVYDDKKILTINDFMD